MTLATYTELEGAVNRYFRRTDRATQVQDWIKLIELEVGRTLDLRAQQLVVAGTLAGGADVLETPVGILYPQQLVFDGSPPININVVPISHGEETAWAAAGQAAPFQASVWGVTSDFKTQIRVWPTPPANIGYTLYYTSTIAPLTPANATNYLLFVAADVYLFGCYYHGELYDKNEEGALRWRLNYDAQIAALKRVEWKARAKVGRMHVRPRGSTP